mmetsp:Transcript_17298/g.56587  ORF Transcript_17298/g.56587 Transcript_17298/m.56587 type:complete len:392 (-) Transcript_17298:657-1832(-)
MLLVGTLALVFTLSSNLGTSSATTIRARIGLQLPPDSVVLITGGAGFIGYHLSLRLKRERIRVIALDSFTPYYSPELKRARAQRLRDAGVQMVEGDLCDEAGLTALIAQHGVTHVASMAAQAGVRYSLSNPQSYVRSNVQCFVSLLEALRATPHVPLIYASSSSVYGSNTKTPFAESDRVDSPNSLYAATKKTDEAIAHVYHGLYGLRLTGLRFFTVYGPWGRPDMAYFSFTRRIELGLPIQVYGHGRPRRDFTYIDDIVDGVVAALALGAAEEVFNLGNHRSESLLRFIKILETELGKKANRTMVPMAPGDVLATYADIRHATDKLGYYPKTRLEDGLHKFMAWYKSPDYRPEFAEGGDWLRPPISKGGAPLTSKGGAAAGDHAVRQQHR